MSFKNIKFPTNFEYSSDGESLPVEFYLDVLPCSKTIYLKLGYFSSKAIRVLAFGFAQFIHNGGVIKIVTNHFLYTTDRELVQPELGRLQEIEESFLYDLNQLKESLESEAHHFINCLKYLVKHGKLEIIPVMLKPNRMVHYKQGIFLDSSRNQIYMEGSCNFTANGLVENAESLSVYRSWGSDFEQNKINGKFSEIESITLRNSSSYEYLSEEQILDAVDAIGEDKTIKELLEDEINLSRSTAHRKKVAEVLEEHKKRLEDLLSSINNSPQFPFNSIPRPYQEEAYQNWLVANKQGIFAMATGTGKTITALNCLLEEYKDTGIYQSLILVPSIPLLNQWLQELTSFNFRKNIILVSSEKSWKSELLELNTSLAFNQYESFVVIATYKSFTSSSFLKRTTNLPEDTFLIADEAHNMGQPLVKKILPSIKYRKRLALSATPKRNYDPDSNEVLESFFNSKEPYTYSFTMERAIREGVLCQYYYYPHLLYLNEEEMSEYQEISKKLGRFFNDETKGFKDSPELQSLLLKRKRIIHKASNKLDVFRQIISQEIENRSHLTYTFVYAPEGTDQEGDSILEKYMAAVNDISPSTRVYAYTSSSENNNEVMENFAKGYVDALFSMKCLDEGVDVPRTELAIFCSSTGNPRQFIQRRGRVLRKHPDKKFAIIHDLVVLPQTSDFSSVEKNLIKQELTRVIHFASLSVNYYESMDECNAVANEYGLDIYALEHELKGEI